MQMFQTKAPTILMVLAGVCAQPAQAQDFGPERVPALVRSAPGFDPALRLCWASGYLQDRDPRGTNLRAGPSAGAKILARVPNRRIEAGTAISPEFQIIGSMKGWLLVRDVRWAGYDLPPAKVYAGMAWVSGALVGVSIENLDLLQRPEPNSPLVMKLLGETSDGKPWSAGDLKIRRIHGCSGSMLDVTLELPGNRTVRGWASGACANQVTTCGGGQGLIYERDGALVPQESD
jgi:hypothetical protein